MDYRNGNFNWNYLADHLNGKKVEPDKLDHVSMNITK